MRRILLVFAMSSVIMAAASGASAAPDATLDTQQGSNGASTQFSEKNPQRVGGEHDIRLITPDMNSRQRMEVQRALQKRAAAKRNQLLLQAASEEQAQQVRTNIPVKP
jgi:hypothetical protein